MSQPVYILGAGRTDFKRNFQREGKTLRHIILEAGPAAITDASVNPQDIQAGIVGNFAAGLFTQQLHLGAFLTEIDPCLHGLPTLHTEAACASGGVAVLTAAKLIMGEIHDLVLVVGVEQQKTMSPSAGAQVLGAAGDFQVESAQFGDFMFPKLFGRIARMYSQHYGLKEVDLARVAVKNHAHARLNPLAQMRDSPLTMQEACTESEANRRIAPPLKVTDCSQITDGGAAVVLCSGRFAARLPKHPRVRLLGYGHTTDYLPLEKKDGPTFSVATKAAQQAYSMAGVQPTDLDAAELHDCFSISEIVGYEVLGFAPRGEGAQLLASGATALPCARETFELPTSPSSLRVQSRPVNPSGGLMGDGHPVGATGVRQVVEAYRQLTGTAGKYQVEGAQRILTFNMGGSFTTNVVMIWEGKQGP
jgi:acetyl-CoA acetyltransferase